MSFKNSYNLNIEAGYGDNTDYDADTNLERSTAVADWINTNLGDIFEASVGTSNNLTYCYIYYRGTNSGMKVQMNTTLNNYCRISIIHCGTAVDTLTNVYLSKSEVNLLVIKSKYGVIAGLYKDSVAGSILTMGINNFDGTFASLVLNSSTMYVSTQANSENTVTLPIRGTSEQAVLSRVNIFSTDLIPEGVYLSTGTANSSCGIFTIGGGNEQYCETAGDSGYAGFALLLEEPGDTDYVWDE